MNIGNEIKTRRNELGLTQEELAKKLNVSRTAVSNWEQQRNYPDIELLVSLSDELGISLDKLLRGDQRMVKELNLDYRKKRWYKTGIIIMSLLFLSALGFSLYAITSIERFQRYNPFISIDTGYAVLPKTVTYNNGKPYEENVDFFQFPDKYQDIEVIDSKTQEKSLLTFSGGQSPENKHFGKLEYKNQYVYKLTFVSWDDIPQDIQKILVDEPSNK